MSKADRDTLRTNRDSQLAEFAEKVLRPARQNRTGLTQAQMGDRLDYTQPQISKLERGIHEPEHATVSKMAEAYQLTDTEKREWFSILNFPDRDLVVGAELFEVAKAAGHELDWEAAIAIHKRAEEKLASDPDLAAKAAVEQAEYSIELSDYSQAEAIIERAQSAYESLVQPQTLVKFSSLRGWLEFYRGDYDRSVQWYKKTISRANQVGIEDIKSHAHHFLGRIYSALGEQARPVNKRLAHSRFERSEEHYAAAVKMDRVRDDRTPYHMIRQAQLMRAQGFRNAWLEARELRDKARIMLGENNPFALLVDLEEARIALMNRHSRLAHVKAQDSLRLSAQIKKARGVADALQLLGTLYMSQGKSELALEHLVAAASAGPTEGTVSSDSLWPTIDLLRLEDEALYRKWVPRIRERALTGRDSFSYLNNLAIDTNSALNDVLDRLESLGRSDIIIEPPCSQV